MSNQCLFGCTCNQSSNFDPNQQVRPNLGSIELDYNVEMPTNFIKGLDGKSAYDYAVKGGYEYDERQFYKDLAGVGGIEAPELHLLAESIKIGEEITVYTGDDSVMIGGYKNGDVIPANATLLDVLKGIFKRVVEYIYTEPIVEIDLIPVDSTFSNRVTPLIGDAVYLNLIVKFMRGDAGFVNSVKLVKNNSLIYEETQNLSTLNRIGHTDVNQVDKVEASQTFGISPGFVYSDSNNYNASVVYDGGAVHTNSDGVISPGRILGATVGKAFTIDAIYPIMFRYSDNLFDPSNLISDISNRMIYGRLAPEGTDEMRCEFTIPTGIKSVALAIPSFKDPSRETRCSLRDVIFDKLSAGMDTLASFSSIHTVDGQSITFMGMPYVVYYLNLDLPITAQDTCRMIITCQ